MLARLTATLNEKWQSIAHAGVLDTPSWSRTFTVAAVDADSIRVETRGGSRITLRRAAFEAALGHLAHHGHVDRARQCGIRSKRGQSGTLSQAISAANGSQTVVVTYVLPILQHLDLVEIARSSPNTTWLA
jgi:hypothetical protein